MTTVPEKTRLLNPPLRFSARTTSGAGRGRKLKVPTINVEIGDAPPVLTHGVYACFVIIDDQRHQGALHFGPRPVFADSESLEVHVLDAIIEVPPAQITIEVVARLRDVQNFPDAAALKQAIASDIAATRGILALR